MLIVLCYFLYLSPDLFIMESGVLKHNNIYFFLAQHNNLLPSLPVNIIFTLLANAAYGIIILNLFMS